MTLTELGAMTGMSAAHLSRLEKGDRQPSIGSLLQLARAYGVSVGALVDEAAANEVLLRAEDVTVHRGRVGRYSVLSGTAGGLAVLRLALKGGQKTDEARHAGEEWLHVLDGSVSLLLDGQATELSAGDSMHFDSARTHQLVTARGTAATVLIASAASRVPTQHPVPDAP